MSSICWFFFNFPRTDSIEITKAGSRFLNFRMINPGGMSKYMRFSSTRATPPSISEGPSAGQAEIYNCRIEKGKYEASDSWDEHDFEKFDDVREVNEIQLYLFPSLFLLSQVCLQAL